MRLTEAEARKLGIPFDPAPRRDGRKCKPGGGMDRQSKKELRESRDKAEALFDQLCVAHGLPVPVHEYKFADGREWKFDYVFEGWLAVEKEGGLFGKGEPCPACKRRPVGAHSSIERLKSDMEKYNEAGILGFVVLRFRPEQFDSGEAFATVKRALENEP